MCWNEFNNLSLTRKWFLMISHLSSKTTLSVVTSGWRNMFHSKTSFKPLTVFLQVPVLPERKQTIRASPSWTQLFPRPHCSLTDTGVGEEHRIRTHRHQPDTNICPRLLRHQLEFWQGVPGRYRLRYKNSDDAFRVAHFQHRHPHATVAGRENPTSDGFVRVGGEIADTRGSNAVYCLPSGSERCDTGEVYLGRVLNETPWEQCGGQWPFWNWQGNENSRYPLELMVLSGVGEAKSNTLWMTLCALQGGGVLATSITPRCCSMLKTNGHVFRIDIKRSDSLWAG